MGIILKIVSNAIKNISRLCIELKTKQPNTKEFGETEL